MPEKFDIEHLSVYLIALLSLGVQIAKLIADIKSGAVNPDTISLDDIRAPSWDDAVKS